MNRGSTWGLWMLVTLGGLAVVAIACGGSRAAPAASTPSAVTAPLAGSRTPEAASAPTLALTPSPTPTAGAIRESEEDLQRDLRAARISTSRWKTNFKIHSVPYKEFPNSIPKDAIPAIDKPVFESVERADKWLVDKEPVQVVEINGDARAYPVQILVWHELVNDVVGGEPILVTY